MIDVAERVTDYLLEVANSEEVGYCNNCPNLKYEYDTGTWDCEYGMAVECCEYSPLDWIQDIANRFEDELRSKKP